MEAIGCCLLWQRVNCHVSGSYAYSRLDDDSFSRLHDAAACDKQLVGGWRYELLNYM